MIRYPLAWLPSRARRARGVAPVLLLGIAVWLVPFAAGPRFARSSALPKQAPGTAALLAFHREGRRLLVTVDRRLLETDFVLRAWDRGRDAGQQEAAGERAPRLTSGALRWREAGDSLLLLEYRGMTGGQLQYRRRVAMAVSYRTPAGAFVTDATPLWQAMMSEVEGPGTAESRALPAAGPEASTSAAVAASSGLLVARVVGRDTVRYQLEVVRLPAVPMQPRLADPRVDLMREQAPDGAEYVRRWRLEKRDPTAPVSEVVRSVPVWMPPYVPDKWVPYVKRVIERYNDVFESMGFRHALEPRRGVPPKAEGEMYGIVIRWNGQNIDWWTDVTDPRTGEMVRVQKDAFNDGGARPGGAGIQHFVALGYLEPNTPGSFVLDAAAAAESLKAGHAGFKDSSLYQFADALVGYPIGSTWSHELGHLLGFSDGRRGQYVGYPTDSMRSRSFLRRMGPLSSVMGYMRFNFAPGPADSVPLEDRVPYAGGAADRWHLTWGYRPIPGATTPEAELDTLDQWWVTGETLSYVRPGPRWPGWSRIADMYAHDGSPEQYNSMGDDPLQYAEAGIRNLGRSLATVPPERQSDLRREAVARSWALLIEELPYAIGGEIAEPPYPLWPTDPKEIRRRSVDPAYQVRVLQAVMARGFYGQDEVVRALGVRPASDSTAVLFDVEGGETWRKTQQGLLAALTNRARLARVAAQDQASGTPAVLPALCRALTALERRLAAATSTGGSAAQAQAQALLKHVTPIVHPRVGFCR